MECEIAVISLYNMCWSEFLVVVIDGDLGGSSIVFKVLVF